jgi:hypothetical protein
MGLCAQTLPQSTAEIPVNPSLVMMFIDYFPCGLAAGTCYGNSGVSGAFAVLGQAVLARLANSLRTSVTLLEIAGRAVRLAARAPRLRLESQ